MAINALGVCWKFVLEDAGFEVNGSCIRIIFGGDSLLAGTGVKQALPGFQTFSVFGPAVWKADAEPQPLRRQSIIRQPA